MHQERRQLDDVPVRAPNRVSDVHADAAGDAEEGEQVGHEVHRLQEGRQESSLQENSQPSEFPLSSGSALDETKQSCVCRCGSNTRIHCRTSSVAARPTRRIRPECRRPSRRCGSSDALLLLLSLVQHIALFRFSSTGYPSLLSSLLPRAHFTISFALTAAAAFCLLLLLPIIQGHSCICSLLLPRNC